MAYSNYSIIACAVLLLGCNNADRREGVTLKDSTNVDSLTRKALKRKREIHDLVLQVKIHYRRSGDMSTGMMAIFNEHDTIHFYKRDYSAMARIYTLAYNRRFYTIQSVMITGYSHNRELYQKLTIPMPSVDEFSDAVVNLHEDRLQLQLVFVQNEIKQLATRNIQMVLDKDWVD